MIFHPLALRHRCNCRSGKEHHQQKHCQKTAQRYYNRSNDKGSVSSQISVAIQKYYQTAIVFIYSQVSVYRTRPSASKRTAKNLVS